MQSWSVIVVAFILGVVCISTATLDTNTECPGLYDRVFRDSVPIANLSAGIYSAFKERDGDVTLRECVLACCDGPCNVALLTVISGVSRCYHIACYSNDVCLPQPNTDGRGRPSMVLVKPVGLGPGISWSDMLKDYMPIQQRYQDAVGSLWRIAEDESSEQHDRMDYSSELMNRFDYTTINTLNNDGVTMTTNLRATTITAKVALPSLHISVDSKQVQLPENNVTLEARVLESDLLIGPPPPLPQFQYEWIALQQPDGVGQATGAIRSQMDNRLELSHLSQGLYLFNVTVSRMGGGTTAPAAAASGWSLANVTVVCPARMNRAPVIVITPTNQTVHLPNTVAILDASASTDDIDTAGLQFHWELQQGPLGYQPTLPAAATLQLGDLTRPGQYTFQLTAADSEGAQAQALAYVTVLAPIDYPPTADAGPDKVLYLPLSDGELVLSGNFSTDDHDIVSWEWTRINTVAVNNNNNTVDTNFAADNDMQAIDMRDTRTATLRLSRIIETGVYTFQLRVGDASNQTSTAQVRLFVKEREQQESAAGLLAIASAGGRGNVTTLPDGQTWVFLDGSNSTVAEAAELYYKWDTLHTPSGNSSSSTSTANISTPQSASTNVTGLTTSGLYQFRLQVSSTSPPPFDNNNSSTAADISSTIVHVTVSGVAARLVPSTVPPRAVALIIADSGGENGNTVQLPRNAIYLNASQSRGGGDDGTDAIVSFRWCPCNDSSPLTVFPVAEGTDRHPVLVLVVGASGRVTLLNGAEEPAEVCWNVTVTDSGGLTDWQTLRFTVLPDVMLEYLVELVVGVSSDLTTPDYNTLLKTVETIFSTPVIHVHVRSGVGGPTINTVLFTIYAATPPSSNNETSSVLFITADQLISHILTQPFNQLISVRPVSCRSVQCSGHGHCDPSTRTCLCHPLWMPSVPYLLSAAGALAVRYDCSWSVLYVALAALFCVAASAALCCCRAGRHLRRSVLPEQMVKVTTQKQRRRSSRGSRNHSYTLIDSVEVNKQRGGGGKLSDYSDDSDRVGGSAADSDDNVMFNSLNGKNINKLLLLPSSSSFNT